MRILGISALDKDATAALYTDGKWKVIAEERLSRRKLHAGFPKQAITELFNMTGLRPEDVEHVAYPFMPWWVEGSRILQGFSQNLISTLINGTPWSAKFGHLHSYRKWCVRAIKNIANTMLNSQNNCIFSVSIEN